MDTSKLETNTQTIERLTRERDELSAAFDKSQYELGMSEGGNLKMRAAIEMFMDDWQSLPEGSQGRLDILEAFKHCLSTSAGIALLARLKEAERIMANLNRRGGLGYETHDAIIAWLKEGAK